MERDLFSADMLQAHAPLAERMRPRTLDEYIGQEHIVGKGKLLRRAMEADRISSLLLYGPPGSGKTTLAHIISLSTQAEFVRLNAVDATVKDVREVIDRAQELLTMYRRRTILFLDEVHRFNRSRQDALLPSVENGTIIFIGATTENPFHSVNGALLSRSTLLQLNPLTSEHSLLAMKSALRDKERGLGTLPLEVEEGALEHLAKMANGDIRRALSALELAVVTTSPLEDGTIRVTKQEAVESIQKPSMRADESTQYDVLSAFHKSIRGSSDAAVFWFLFAVDKLGMDPRTFIRRLIVACSEDIGLANPNAMPQAVAAMQAFDIVGWPESKFMISQAILFAVESPKSNSVTKSIGKVYQLMDRFPEAQVPMHLRDTHYSGAEKLGNVGYLYPHDYPNHYVEQAYLPEIMKDETIYDASDQGTEAKIQQNQKLRRQRKLKD